MRGIWLVGLGLLLCAIPSASGAEKAADSPRFSRDVRPILAEHCLRCHGLDERQRRGDLRLDRESDAKQMRDSQAAIVAGKPADSELWRRVTSNDPDLRMPPADSGTQLSSAELDTLRKWIEQGAVWEDHWAFLPPRVPEYARLPSVPTARSMIDVLAIKDSVDGESLAYLEADKETLIRRVTLDLTGIPPTLDEIDTFLADERPNAYERLVDRLLASPRYGERMAWPWLEAARYADTSGYQNDGPRSMWRWRDWVIDALNSGMPFDQFTREQLAGDLLPNPSLEQRVATGFNRNHRGNSEGGIIPEEYQVEYVVDRVDTTATVWLGLTLGCARCHEHKYDPITQTDFYRVFAYFNNIPEYGRAIKEGNSPPLIPAPTREQQRRQRELEQQVKSAEARWLALGPELERRLAEWMRQPGLVAPNANLVSRDAQTDLSLDDSAADLKRVDGGWRGQPGGQVDGAVGQAIQLDGSNWIELPEAGNFGYLEPFAVSMWIKADSTDRGVLVSRMTDDEEGDGWAIQFSQGRLQVNLVKRWLDDAVRVETVGAVPAGNWTHVAMTYDGSRLAKGVAVYLNGQRTPLVTRLDLLNQTFAVKEPLRIGAGSGAAARFRGAIDAVRLFGRALRDEEIVIESVRENVGTIVTQPPDQRSAGATAKLREYFLRQVAPLELRAAREEWLAAQSRFESWLAGFPTVMVMEEMAVRRPTHVLVRGEYNRPAELVAPELPQSLRFGPQTYPATRLGFADWLVSDHHPLTARVAVNRLWQLHWGAGLVRTTEDFGLQGTPPTHPELLDWLALELVGASPRSRWDVKGIQRKMVTSAWYRSPSQASPGNQAFPRTRWSADIVRDQALAAAGLLVESLGGPSVKIYQPADLWKDLATDSVYERDRGAGLYRRSLYSYWKRTVAPPSLTTLDAATRESCQVRAARTNTPLQALTLLNEVTFVEAARAMAERVLNEGEAQSEARVRLAFRIATSRQPTDQEVSVLVRQLASNRDYFASHPSQAEQFVQQGDSKPNPALNPVELASWTVCCNLLLNLDEVLTK